MIRRAVVVDTNVVVAALLTREAEAATARILDGMLAGRFPYLLSEALLAEYRSVLLRPAIAGVHGLAAEEIDRILLEIARNGAVREPGAAPEPSPDPGDQHLWDLVFAEPVGVLITGDARLLAAGTPPEVVTPRAFLRAQR